jgi:hypothetical protein
MMLQQRRFIRLPLVGMLLLALLVGAYLVMAARKRLTKEDGDAGVARHSVTTSAEDTLKYWTEEKMRSAKPAKMPKIKPLERGKKRPKRPPV